MRRYLSLFLGLTALAALLAGALSFAVDPYRLHRDEPAAVKPKAGANGPVAKAYGVLRAAPRTLILGNSRAEVGLDPQHAAWPAEARPVYNLALPGTGVGTSLAYLRHALEAPGGRVGSVVLGLDLMDYLVDARAAPEVDAPPDARLYGAASAEARRWRVLRDQAQATLTLNALLDAAQTVAAQGDRFAADLDAQGFNPMRDYLKIGAEQGYWQLFRQKDEANARAWLRRPGALAHADGREGTPLATLRQLIVLCRERGVALRLFIYPYHAHLLEIVERSGHWSAFEDWKRRLVALVQEEGRGTVALWDFSGYGPYADEAVPARSDRKTAMRWYWEAGHFKKELGDRMLARMVGGAGDGTFGAQLEPGMVDAHLAALRVGQQAYRSSHAGEVQELAALIDGMRARPKSNP